MEGEVNDMAKREAFKKGVYFLVGVRLMRESSWFAVMRCLLLPLLLL